MIETFTDQDKILAYYYLDELGEAEIIELQDEMLLNDELTERAQVVEMNLIDGYVRGEMTPEESRRFKEGFLAIPENKDKVSHAQMFHKSLRLLHENQQGALAAFQNHGWRQWVSGLFQRPLPALAFTAAAILLIAALFFVVIRQRPHETGNTFVKNSAPAVPDNINRGSNTASDHSVIVAAPTPEKKPSVVPSVNNSRNGSGMIARNYSDRYRQEAQLNPSGRGAAERSGGKVVNITLRKKVTKLQLIYELIEGVPKKEVYSVTIKDEDGELIWPPKELRPVKIGHNPNEFIILEVPTSIFKRSGPYKFEFGGPEYIQSPKFTIKK